ncbi:UNVERIFIED_CONTAM: hypothetical protein GTU68_047029 [Idotea baltica]|nr:hypothetical protein [Idotea baltica]
MPILYSALIEEHNAVRENVGLFDVSHMGIIFFKGEKALDLLQFVTSNDVSKVKPGKAQYNALMREDGALVDDIIVYCEGKNSYFAIVNASNIEKDYKHFVKHNNYDVEINNRSEDFGLIAIQGPKAWKVISKVLSNDVSQLKYFSHGNFSFKVGEEIAEVKVARTGYTGEDGFEVLVENKFAENFWTALLNAGSNDGIKPIGLGARDTLRLEACYSLYGHELGEDISLIESGLSWICKCNKGDFLGKDIVCNEKANGSKRSLVAFEVTGKGIVREETKIFVEDKEIGFVTSGTRTPTVGKSIGLALISSNYSSKDTTIFAEVRGRRVELKIVDKPFYKKK